MMDFCFSLCSANVLLDLSFRAKVGDFGLARPIHDTSETRTSRVVGTSGYIPPEYYRGTITTKMDSFAFGVVSNTTTTTTLVFTHIFSNVHGNTAMHGVHDSMMLADVFKYRHICTLIDWCMVLHGIVTVCRF